MKTFLEIERNVVPKYVYWAMTPKTLNKNQKNEIKLGEFKWAGNCLTFRII